MGGSSYDRDVGTSSGGSFYSGGTSSSSAKEALDRRYMDTETSPNKRKVSSGAESPIVLALDVTGSNIEFARIVYDKAPMFYGQIEQTGYLKDFDVCFAAVGDAYSDSAPLQVCDFQKGIALDDWLKKLYLEGNGGGQQTESYELAAYYFGKHCSMPNAKTPYMFFIADEAPYPQAEKEIIRKVAGTSERGDIDSNKVFSDLFTKFNGNVYVIQNGYGGRAWGSDSDRIRREWLSYIGSDHDKNIIRVYEEKSVVDVMLGVIAITSGARTLEGYLADMHGRSQTKTRSNHVEKSIGGLAGMVTAPIVTATAAPVTAAAPAPVTGALPTGKAAGSHKSGGKRI